MNEIAKTEEKLTKAEWELKTLSGGSLFGIPITRYRELYDLFMRDGFNLRADEDFNDIKKIYFNVGGE